MKLRISAPPVRPPFALPNPRDLNLKFQISNLKFQIQKQLNQKRFACRASSQYLGILGSTSSAHASTPPFRFHSFLKPAVCRKWMASAERLPLRQCTTISTELSSSFTRRESSPSGINFPFRLQI